MTVTAVATAAPKLDLGWVLGRTTSVLGRRAVDLLILGLPFLFLPDALVSFLPDDLTSLRFITGLPSLVFIGAVSLLAYREISGGVRLSAHEAMTVGLRRFGSLWIVGIITGLATVVGLIALIAPGIFLIAAWMPASAVVVVEESGATASLSRAWALTDGLRWPLVGLLGIAFGVVLALLLLVFLFSALLAVSLGPDLAEKVAGITITPIFDVVLLSITTVGSTAAYAGLRLAKEGSLGGVAEVFG